MQTRQGSESFLSLKRSTSPRIIRYVFFIITFENTHQSPRQGYNAKNERINLNEMAKLLERLVAPESLLLRVWQYNVSSDTMLLFMSFPGGDAGHADTGQ